MGAPRPNCLFCGYPGRSKDSCEHCSGTFPCCQKLQAEIAHLRKLLAENRELVGFVTGFERAAAYATSKFYNTLLIEVLAAPIEYYVEGLTVGDYLEGTDLDARISEALVAAGIHDVPAAGIHDVPEARDRQTMLDDRELGTVDSPCTHRAILEALDRDGLYELVWDLHRRWLGAEAEVYQLKRKMDACK